MIICLDDAEMLTAIRWSWSVFCQYFHLKVDEIPSLSIGIEEGHDIQLSVSLIDLLKNKTYNSDIIFPDGPLMRSSDGHSDYLGTAFYLINCLQEYNAGDDCFDQYGRFKPECSIQERFRLHQENYVGECFEQLAKTTPKLAYLKAPVNPSRILLTHDIDLIHHGLLQEGNALLKRGRFDLLFLLIARHVLSGPSWSDMGMIMDIHDEYDVKSVFFWLAERGEARSHYTGAEIYNSDYKFNHPRLLKQRKIIRERGFEMGIHKSVGELSFTEELARFEAPVVANRNHYLLYRLPEHFDLIEEAGLQVDCTLGFAGRYGFRNSYSLPFVPFNMKKDRPYTFLEVPVNLMDTTFRNYLGHGPEDSTKMIIEFLERHRNNSVLSLIWHNNMFSKYKHAEWLKQYKLILDYLRQNHIRATSIQELYEEFYQE